ncbi:MAG: glycerol-3-phosphate dehydrogenase/oxidase [Planctomycetaceae bacterium]
MQRDVSQLRSTEFDVLIVGGGIYGCWMACHAAAGGLKTAVIDQGDWASATSSASSKLLHGGLRYLERFEFQLVRKSLHERRELHRLMPHHVRPLRFLLPVYRGSRVGRLKLKAGLWMYDFLAGKNQPVAGHRSFSTAELRREELLLKSANLLGGFSYGDCGTDDARMTLEVIDTAVDHGAAACNYVRADQLLMTSGRAAGVVATDLETQEQFELHARLVINASGPWVFRHFGLSAMENRVRLTRGVHLVMPRLSSDNAMLLTARSDGRVVFLIPWYNRTLLGTTDTDYHGDPNSVQVELQDVEYLLNVANDAVDVSWTRDDILGSFVGLRTLQNQSGASASAVSREWSFEESVPGLLTSLGGKYTSARVDALAVIVHAAGLLKYQKPISSVSAMKWTAPDEFSAWQQTVCREAGKVGIDAATAELMARRYGKNAACVTALAADQPGLASRIVHDLPFCRAEVVYSAMHEMPRTLTDLLRRRIPLKILTPLNRRIAEDVCQLAAEVLGWSPERREQEITSVVPDAVV